MCKPWPISKVQFSTPLSLLLITRKLMHNKLRWHSKFRTTSLQQINITTSCSTESRINKINRELLSQVKLTSNRSVTHLLQAATLATVGCWRMITIKITTGTSTFLMFISLSLQSAAWDRCHMEGVTAAMAAADRSCELNGLRIRNKR